MSINNEDLTSLDRNFVNSLKTGNEKIINNYVQKGAPTQPKVFTIAFTHLIENKLLSSKITDLLFKLAYKKNIRIQLNRELFNIAATYKHHDLINRLIHEGDSLPEIMYYLYEYDEKLFHEAMNKMNDEERNNVLKQYIPHYLYKEHNILIYYKTILQNYNVNLNEIINSPHVLDNFLLLNLLFEHGANWPVNDDILMPQDIFYQKLVLYLSGKAIKNLINSPNTPENIRNQLQKYLQDQQTSHYETISNLMTIIESLPKDLALFTTDFLYLR